MELFFHRDCKGWALLARLLPNPTGLLNCCEQARSQVALRCQLPRRWLASHARRAGQRPEEAPLEVEDEHLVEALRPFIGALSTELEAHMGSCKGAGAGWGLAGCTACALQAALHSIW